MDFHIIMVHFPIALLTIYSLMEIFRFKIIKNFRSYIYVKASFLIIGVMSAFIALITGDIVGEALEYQAGNIGALTELHSGFAVATTILYAVLAVIYILVIFFKIETKDILTQRFEIIEKTIFVPLIKITYFTDKIYSSFLMILLAITGLILITFTGALGGAISHGPQIDPIVTWIYNLFF